MWRFYLECFITEDLYIYDFRRFGSLRSQIPIEHISIISEAQNLKLQCGILKANASAT